MSSINVPVPMIVSSDIEAEEMSIGQKLTSGVSSVIDKKPYLFRASAAGSADVAVDKIVGGTVAWNQLVATPFSPMSANGHVPLVVGTKIVAGHKYLCLTKQSGLTVNSACSVYCRIDGVWKTAVSCPHIESDSTQYYIKEAAYSGVSLGTTATTDGNAVANYNKGNNTSGTLDNLQVYDLTLMFGPAIADYAYTLESNTAGSGIAWLQKYGFFTKLDYENNAGQLMSVKTSAHKIVGFNQWDEEYQLGYYGSNGVFRSSTSGYLSSKNKIPVIPSTSYHIKVDVSTPIYICYYDGNGTFVERVNLGSNPSTERDFTTPSYCYFVNFSTGAGYGTTYNNNICVNLSKTTGYPQNGQYKSYSERSYALDDIELRGILKLDASNNLYYDGDEYASDGAVTRRYGIVDLGNLNWTKSTYEFRSTSAISNILKPSQQSIAASLAICSRYQILPSNASGGEGVHQGYTGVSINTDGKIWARNDDFSSTTEENFKTAMSGIYLVYALATPTTESADPYTNPQKVSADGTEEYVDERDVPIPVGHETQYIERSSFVNNQNGAFKMTVSSNGVVI